MVGSSNVHYYSIYIPCYLTQHLLGRGDWFSSVYTQLDSENI